MQWMQPLNFGCRSGQLNQQKFFLWVIIFLFINCQLNLFNARAEPPPIPNSVIDLTNTFKFETLSPIDKQIAMMENRELCQCQVIIGNVPKNETIASFAERYFSYFRLGRENIDDGLLIVVDPTAKQVRIEVGRGLEGDLTDLLAARIIKEQMIPGFRSGSIANGILAGLMGIDEILSAASKSTPGQVTNSQDSAHSNSNLPAGRESLPISEKTIPKQNAAQGQIVPAVNSAEQLPDLPFGQIFIVAISLLFTAMIALKNTSFLPIFAVGMMTTIFSTATLRDIVCPRIGCWTDPKMKDGIDLIFMVAIVGTLYIFVRFLKTSNNSIVMKLRYIMSKFGMSVSAGSNSRHDSDRRGGGGSSAGGGADAKW